MKISYRTHPIIERLETGKLGKLSSTEKDFETMLTLREKIRSEFQSFARDSFQYFYITKPFSDAFNASSKKLINSSLWADVEDGNYCFLDSTVGFCLKVKNNKTSGLLDCEVVCVYGNKIPNESPMLSIIGKASIWYDLLKDDNGLLRSEGFKGFESSINEQLFNESIIGLIGTYVIFILFIKYADLEIKHLPASSKVKDIECKYINETKSNIQVLNSKWFTTLVKSDAFKVRGHFRLQPKKKDGEWTKELIWINDFQKEGYIAKARMLNQ